MMDFSGSNRGFFFVRYTCREDAKRACKELDNFEIRPHKRLGVLMSMDNNKLWLSGIPNGATADDIRVRSSFSSHFIQIRDSPPPIHGSKYRALGEIDKWIVHFIKVNFLVGRD